jgi:hypothetical protein
METIAQLKNLRSLNLRAARITDAGMPHLGSLSGLKELDIGQTNVTAAGLKALAWSDLESLTLWKCQRINDDAVDALAGMKKLKWLDIAGSAITAEGAVKLRQALPGCPVQH